MVSNKDRIALKLFKLYKDTTLNDKQLRTMTNELLDELETDTINKKNKIIEKLKKDAEDLNQLKRILSRPN